MWAFLLFMLLVRSIPFCYSIGPGLSSFKSRQNIGATPSLQSVSSTNSGAQNQPIANYNPEANSYAYWNCHTIPPNMTLCKSVGYSQMVLPNFLQHESIREVIQQANVWVALVNTDCHPDIQRFLCSLYAPVCLKSHQEAKIPPCWELCDQVRTACLPRMRLFGFDWPEIVQCKQFPRLAESMCIPPQEHSTVKCAPCEQAITLENIASSYCMADVVLKASLNDILPESNKAALRLIPTIRTQSLKLTRRDGTITTKFDVQRLRRRSRQRRLRYRHLRSRVYRHAVPSRSQLATETNLRQPAQSSWSRPFNRNQTMTNPWYEKNASPESIYRRKAIPRSATHRRRARNSQLYDLDGITELVLGCSACASLVPFIGSPNSPSTENRQLASRRWLIMGRRLIDENTKQYSNRVQVTFLVPWDRNSQRFRRSLVAIRTQPVSRLCPKQPSVITDPILTPSGPVMPIRNVKISRSAPSELSDAPSQIRSGHQMTESSISTSTGKADRSVNTEAPTVNSNEENGPPLVPRDRLRMQATTSLYQRWNTANDLGHVTTPNNFYGTSMNKKPRYPPWWSRTGIRPSDAWMQENSRRQQRRRWRRRGRGWKRRRREQQQQQKQQATQSSPAVRIPLRDKPINPYGEPESEARGTPYWTS